MLNHPAVQLLTVIVALISAVGGVYATVVSRRKTNSEANKMDAESEQTSDKTWIARLDALSKDLGKLQALSDERFERMVELERLITEHVTWDFEVVRLLRQHQIDVADPPNLVYIRRKLAEEKNAIKKEMGTEGLEAQDGAN